MCINLFNIKMNRSQFPCFEKRGPKNCQKMLITKWLVRRKEQNYRKILSIGHQNSNLQFLCDIDGRQPHHKKNSKWRVGSRSPSPDWFEHFILLIFWSFPIFTMYHIFDFLFFIFQKSDFVSVTITFSSAAANEQQVFEERAANAREYERRQDRYWEVRSCDNCFVSSNDASFSRPLCSAIKRIWMNGWSEKLLRFSGFVCSTIKYNFYLIKFSIIYPHFRFDSRKRRLTFVAHISVLRTVPSVGPRGQRSRRDRRVHGGGLPGHTLRHQAPAHRLLPRIPQPGSDRTNAANDCLE